jgi:hypothetical protein
MSSRAMTRSPYAPAAAEVALQCDAAALLQLVPTSVRVGLCKASRASRARGSLQQAPVAAYKQTFTPAAACRRARSARCLASTARLATRSPTARVSR